MAEKNTDKLFAELKSEKSVESYLQNNAAELAEMNLAAYLEDLRMKKQLTKAQVVKGSGLDEHYVYHILSGKKQPSRNKVLGLAFGVKADLTETQQLLRYAKQNVLYPRDKWDAVIISAVNRGLSVNETNELLYQLGETVTIV